jgi:polyhydroxyalkanoate synthase
VLAGNPAALKRAFDTGGLSLLRGGRNLVRDVVVNRGLPSQVDDRPYTVGENLPRRRARSSTATSCAR